jgi:hypothetical protein
MRRGLPASRRIPVNASRQSLDQLGEPINALVRCGSDGLSVNLRVNERSDLLLAVYLCCAELVDPIRVRVEALAVISHKLRERHEGGFQLCDSILGTQFKNPLQN